MILKNSMRQSEILELLAKIRGANADQITRALYNKNSFSNLTQTYELLNKLTGKKYVEYFYYNSEGKEKRLYYLSKRGLILFQDFYKIEEGKRGTGLFKDFGHFTHALYKPKKNQIKHLLMSTDAMITVYQLKKELDQENLTSAIDFANNLYCATKFVKPDFLIHFEGYKYFVEIDRMNERGIALNKKFEKYNLYFKQVDATQIKGIYFIVPTPKNYKVNQFDPKQQLRFESVVNAYFATCNDYKDKIDLCFVNMKNFENVLNEDFNRPQQNSKLINNYVKLEADTRLVKIEDVYYKINENRNVLGLLIELNFNRTKVWFDLLKLQKQYSIKIKQEGILQFEDYKYIPDVKIITIKKNLMNIIEENEYPSLSTINGTVKKIPEVLFFE